MNMRLWNYLTTSCILLIGLSQTHTVWADDRADLQLAAQRGDVFKAQGKVPEAIAEYEKALPLAIKLVGADHDAVWQLHVTLGDLYTSRSEYPKAKANYQKAIAVLELKQGKSGPQTLSTLSALAFAHEATDDFDEAEPIRQRVVAAMKATVGMNNPLTAAAIDALALAQAGMGQHNVAEINHLQALAIRESALGKDHLDVAITLSGLADLYRKKNEFKKAEAAARRGLAIREARLPSGHISVADSWVDLGNVLQFSRRQNEAAALYEKALPVYEKTHGKRSLATSHLVNAMALNQHKLGNHAAAKPIYERAIAIQTEIAGRDHPATVLPRHNYAILLAAMKDYPASARAFTEVRKLQLEKMAQVLPALSEAEQLNFLTNVDERMWHVSLSLGLQQRDDAAVTEASAAWLLNRKAMSQQILSEQALLARDSRTAAVATLVRQLTAIRSQLAGLTHGLTGTGTVRQQLAESEQAVVKKLAQAGTRVLSNRWVDVAAVRERVPDNAVLIEIAKYQTIDFQSTDDDTRWSPHRYAAWLIRKNGVVQVVDLGPAEPLDKAVAAARTDLESAAKTIQQKGEPNAEKQLRKRLEKVSSLLLPPLMKHLSTVEHWVVSPDGNLWLLPWECLPVDGGKFLVETRSIRYVVTGRDLLNSSAKTTKPSAPILIADPDFYLGRDKAAAELRTLVKDKELGNQSRASLGLILGNIPRLPGTAVEAEAVAPRLTQYAGSVTKVFTESQALEGVFKSAKNPKVVVLSTHGFFLPEQDASNDSSKRDDNRENPLLRCGLLLAGCNDRRPPPPGGDDGVLTGLEIVGTDLRGTEMVVLSACETGLGEVRNGEGVAGLRQAFQLAGAESVVATLWQIPDVQSAQLMVGFFDNLTKKLPRDEALRAAQLEQIKNRRDRFGAAHPYFWAAYTLTGQVK